MTNSALAGGQGASIGFIEIFAYLKSSTGKTAPRVIDDLAYYDPRHKARSGYNVLTTIPQWEDRHFKVDPEPGQGSCRHEWTFDEEHSWLLEQGKLPTAQSTFCVVAHCSACRSHLVVTLDFLALGDDDSFLPCPNVDAPLHHFVHEPKVSQDLPLLQPGAIPALWFDKQVFRCSSGTCQARLSVIYRPARLTPTWIRELTDKGVLKERADHAISSDPARFEGHAPPLAVEVLANLRTYIQNGMRSSEQRKILGANKKWKLCFNDSCTELLEYLGFRRDGDDWFPPSPGPSGAAPSEENLYNRLNHVEKELLMLIAQRPSEEKRAAKLPDRFNSPEKSLKTMLGTLDHRTDVRSRAITITEPEHPFYAGLGTKRDFHDELIVFAYQRQIDVDQANTGYYLECLEGIAKGRKSEALETKAALEHSRDKVSNSEVRNAYKELGVPRRSDVDEDTILGTFQARLADAPKFQEEQLRRALKIIGEDRQSWKLQDAASMSVTTYEQALAFLNATDDISDDAVPAVYAAKVADSKSDEPRARQAVSLIADHRKSNALHAWLETGEMGQVEMDIGHAYNRLEVSDRMIDDETILAAYNAYVAETPSQLSDLKNALTSIAKSRNSTMLLNFLGTGQVIDEHKLSEWPVGLENIGNTCYLNSLLQSYFTILPLRNLVLDFNKYRMPIDAAALSVKQVGSRRVLRKEIERAQRFVVELQKLFNEMITAPRAQVTPHQELARLTLISSTNEEIIRRRSTTRGQRPSLGDIDGRPVLGPTLPPPPSIQATQPDVEITESPLSKMAGKSIGEIDADDSSEDTLVDVSVPNIERRDSLMTGLEVNEVQQQQNILDDKENLPPSKTASAQPDATEVPLDLLGPASPSRMNRMARALSPVKEIESSTEQSEGNATTLPPSRPPPVPPRPENDPKESIQEQLEIGAQQDVTEVIGNVLFQLQCAIKPERIDDKGEQIDMVKRVFYGKQKSNTINLQGQTRTKEEFFSDIKVNVASQPRDMYAALDGAFDLQEVEVDGDVERQYTTISQIPPVLQVHITRSEFDKEKQTTTKSNHHIEMKPTLYMDRYLDSADPDLMVRRKEYWSWKEQLARLRVDKQKDERWGTEGLPKLVELLGQINDPEDPAPISVSPDLVADLEAEGTRYKKRLEVIESELKDLETKIDTQFADLRQTKYHLHSVFIHRGGPSSGHYWVYIYDFSQKEWRKYNDGYVTLVKDHKEIYDKELGSRPATPYFLVYVRGDVEEQLADAVCRRPVEPPPYTQDVVMEEAIPSVEFEHKENVNGGYASEKIAGAIGGWDSSRSAQLANW